MTEQRSGETLSGEAGLERVATIARALARAESLDETFQRVVDLAEGYIEHCHGATMILLRDGRISTPAASNREALRADEAQHAAREGPCLSAFWEEETVVVDDLRQEQRWPVWRDKVADLGWRSMVGLRLFVADDSMGALNLYSRRPHGFDAHSRALGQVFASHAAVAMKAAIAEAGLERALVSRDVIGQAKGILMEREHLTGQQAFDRLRQLSNERNTKLRRLAEDIATTGEIPT